MERPPRDEINRIMEEMEREATPEARGLEIEQAWAEHK